MLKSKSFSLKNYSICFLVLQKSQWGPSLLKVIPISKTRNGMQFSCAASNVDTQPGTKEVWVCNTDGHVGQVNAMS